MLNLTLVTRKLCKEITWFCK